MDRQLVYPFFSAREGIIDKNPSQAFGAENDRELLTFSN